MLTPDGTRLEVWGDSVAHSLSPQLHTAAYRVLGLDWSYERRQVSKSAFDAELAGLSRVSVRRYLEHYLSEGLLEVRLEYGGAGRPVRRYRPAPR